MTQEKYQYYKNITMNMPLPSAYIDMDIFDENLRNIAKRAQEKQVRIASKSIRCPFLLRYILEKSDIFQGIMCYSAEEAIYLHRNSFSDLLIAYPIVNKNKIQSLCVEIQKKAQFILMVDCIEHVDVINSIAKNFNVQVSVCIDVDMSSSFPGLHFGVRRSPLKTPEQVAKIAHYIEESKNVSFSGIMGYEAQIAGVGDKSPYNNIAMNQIIRCLKKYSVRQIKKRRKSVVEILEKQGLYCKIVNGGGSGSLETTRQENCITELTVGSAFYSPMLFDYYSNFQHIPAAFYAIEITRIPCLNTYTCYAGGYVASGTGKDKIPRPYLPKNSRLLNTEGAGEVQTPIVYKGKQQLKHGDPIFMRHSKAGELCEHFRNLHLIRAGKIVNTVKTYRGEEQCFI